ncbi:BlaI/MecI/CopY family transcriptional regulator [Methanopyrus kandleri]|uniref:Fe2+/Zn2+ uptake regulator n=1 Tax=Methanopyrus kandleri (strain AV19 / DSM 6324 / JCM 9639 / NBRC 100938) TaxID=190192 RepID=Q8TVX7_METKA|nr:BlaI/MecI/CopY family transcriptional regulator [Methanopyrus kandleri]AAM02474.1 Fe2+/Zn2+ uptake regulator [Methanopyrus kandleri AV19]
MLEERELEELAKALKRGELDKTGAVLGLLYLAYVETGGHGGMTADDVVRVLQESGYDITKERFYSLASQLMKKGYIESHKINGRRVIYTINSDSEYEVEQKLRERLEKSAPTAERVSAEEMRRILDRHST